MRIKKTLLKLEPEKDIFREFWNVRRDKVIIPDFTTNPYSDNQSALLTKRIVSLLKIDANLETMTKKQADDQLYPQYLLMHALVEYLYFEAPHNEQNIYMVMELLAITENGQYTVSDLDKLFNLLSEKEQNQTGTHIALVHYRKFKIESNGRDKSIAEALRRKLRPYFSLNDDLFEIAGSTSTKYTACFLLTLLLRTFHDDRPSDENHNSFFQKLKDICNYHINRRRASRLFMNTLRVIQMEHNEETSIIDVKKRLDEMPTLGRKWAVTILDVIKKLDEMPDTTPGKIFLKKVTYFFSEFN
jgi:hypothetical protein